MKMGSDKKIAVGWLLLVCSQWLHAAPVKLEYLKAGSLTYSNVTVMRVTETDLYFSHDKGMANTKLKYLEPELQKKFDFNPQLATEIERRQTREDSLFQGAVASNLASNAVAVIRAAAAPEDSLADAVSDKSILGKPGPGLQ